jgi:glycosyltransferase involved in cell wall biosynthesis
MKKSKIVILTTRFGGPYNWANELKRFVEKNKIPLEIKIKSSFWSLLLSPFYVGDCDIVHSIQPIPFKLWKQPYVLNPRGDFTSEFSIRNPWSLLYPLAIKNADHVVVPSRYLKQKLKIKKCSIIHNCLDPTNYLFKKSYKLGKCLKISTVTSFAFKDKAEGILNIINILKCLKIDRNIIFSIYAGGTYSNYIKKEVEGMSVPKNIKIDFKGHVKNSHRELIRSDIFAYYSVHDNFPNSVLEAMACAMPIITNKFGAIKEMISRGRDGYIAKKDKEYAFKLESLCKIKTRENLGKSAREKVKLKFTWETSIIKWHKLYKAQIYLKKEKSPS